MTIKSKNIGIEEKKTPFTTSTEQEEAYLWNAHCTFSLFFIQSSNWTNNPPTQHNTTRHDSSFNNSQIFDSNVN